MPAFAYELITARIIALLEQGTVPWQRSWDASTSWPQNFISQKPYHGINVLMLLSMDYKSPFWLTFHQVSQLGGMVRKAEHACPVVFWKKKEDEEETGQERSHPVLRYYYLFNIAQCDGVEKKTNKEGGTNEKTAE